MATIPKSPTTDFTSTTLNGAVNDSTTTITVNDASTIVVPAYGVIDREDANGNPTPNQREVVYISGKTSNDLTVTRGVDNSTARSHNDGAKFEPMLTVGFWDDFYDAYDNEHTPYDGSHDITKVAMLSGTTVQTLENKILSAPTITLASLTTTYIGQATIAYTSLPTSTIGALTITTSAYASGASLGGFYPSGASGSVLTSRGSSSGPIFNVPTLASKVITGTRDLATASGDVAHTGVGFSPSAIICFGIVDGNDFQVSWGFSDGSKAGENITKDTATTFRNLGSKLVFIQTAGGAYQSAVVKTYDSDGFTVTWTKVGLPTGTLKLMFLCLR